jgi:hypothetical protein
MNMPTKDLPVRDTPPKTEILPENAEDTLAVPPPSFRERLKAAQRARRTSDIFTPVKPEPPCKGDLKTPLRKD